MSRRPRSASYDRRVTLFDELMALAAELDRSEVAYALVGGLAVAVWGAPRATKDIDLLVRVEALPSALAAAERCGFDLRALPMRFRDGMQLQRVSRVAAGQLLTVDFILATEDLEPVWRSRQKLATGTSALWVVSREALIQMKVAAGRPQDVADVEKLRELDR